MLLQMLSYFQPWLTLTLTSQLHSSVSNNTARILSTVQNKLSPPLILEFLLQVFQHHVVFRGTSSIAPCDMRHERDHAYRRRVSADLCLNTALFKASMSPCLPAVMDGSLPTRVDLVTPGRLFFLFFSDWQADCNCEVVAGMVFFLPFILRGHIMKWDGDKFIKIEILIFSSVMWHGKSLLNYSMALLCSTPCAWWLDLQGPYCWEENSVLWSEWKEWDWLRILSSSPQLLQKPPEETSKYGTCENSEEQDFIQTSLVWCWKREQPVWPRLKFGSFNNISPTMLELQMTSGDLASVAASGQLSFRGPSSSLCGLFLNEH